MWYGWYTTETLWLHLYTSLLPLFLQVTLPVPIAPRWGHSTVVFGSGPGFRVVVLFGGRSSSLEEVSETTLLLLGKCAISTILISLERLCVVISTLLPNPRSSTNLFPIIIISSSFPSHAYFAEFFYTHFQSTSEVHGR